MVDRRRRRWAWLAILAVVVAGCGGDGAATTSTAQQFVALDGSPRHPDDEGVVTNISNEFATLTLDGEREYAIHEAVQSFAALDGSTQPIRSRLGQYVHVGLRGDTIVWISAIGSVVRVPGQPETVLYLADIVGTEAGGTRLVLRDGTVFDIDGTFPDVADGDVVPAVLRIDVATDKVTSIEVAG